MTGTLALCRLALTFVLALHALAGLGAALGLFALTQRLFALLAGCSLLGAFLGWALGVGLLLGRSGQGRFLAACALGLLNLQFLLAQTRQGLAPARRQLLQAAIDEKSLAAGAILGVKTGL